MAVNSGRKVYIEVDTADVGDTGTATWTRIAQQRGGSKSRGTETADSTHKDDDGWQSGVVTRLNWSLSGDGVLSTTDPVYAYIHNKFKAKLSVWVRCNAQDIGGSLEYGQAWITDFSEEFPENDVVSFSIEFTGDGPLKPLAV